MIRLEEVKQAHLIIGLAVFWWVIGIIWSRTHPPAVIVALGAVLFVVSVLTTVIYLILRGSGWGPLARRFPAARRHDGPWRTCPTVVMSAEDSFQPLGTRLRFVVRVGASPDSLFLSAIPVFGWFLRPIQIPWTEIESAKPYQAGGWMAPIREPATLFQLEYDFGYRGAFVQLGVRDPEVYIHLPADALAESAARLPPAGPAA